MNSSRSTRTGRYAILTIMQVDAAATRMSPPPAGSTAEAVNAQYIGNRLTINCSRRQRRRSYLGTRSMAAFRKIGRLRWPSGSGRSATFARLAQTDPRLSIHLRNCGRSGRHLKFLRKTHRLESRERVSLPLAAIAYAERAQFAPEAPDSLLECDIRAVWSGWARRKFSGDARTGRHVGARSSGNSFARTTS